MFPFPLNIAKSDKTLDEINSNSICFVSIIRVISSLPNLFLSSLVVKILVKKTCKLISGNLPVLHIWQKPGASSTSAAYGIVYINLVYTPWYEK